MDADNTPVIHGKIPTPLLQGYLFHEDSREPRRRRGE